MTVTDKINMFAGFINKFVWLVIAIFCLGFFIFFFHSTSLSRHDESSMNRRCPLLKVVDYDGEEDLDKLVTSPRSESYSAQVSPTPAEDVELAEEVFGLSLESEDQKPEDCAKQDYHAKAERRSSSSWKGFSLKKQLSRVDMKLKHTFSAPPEKTSSTKRGSIFYSNAIPCAERESGEMSPEMANSPENEEVPSIVLIKQGDLEDDVADSESAVRPTDLQLYDTAGKPIRPPRKDRKRVSVDQKTPNYRSDTRLLSVPNIKYNHQQGLRDLRRKEAMKQSVHNNQAFGNIIRKISKSTVSQLYHNNCAFFLTYLVHGMCCAWFRFRVN